MRWRVDYNWETEHGCGFQDKGFDTQEQAREFIEQIQQNEHKKINPFRGTNILAYSMGLVNTYFSKI